MDRTEVYGGLINRHGATHVIVAVQALLRTSHLVEFLVGYSDHRKRCRSLLQCIACALFRLYDSICQKGIADPAAFVMRWNGISSRMTVSNKTDPFEVLSALVDLMRSECILSNAPASAEGVGSSPITKMFEITSRLEVHCATCGKHPQYEFCSSLHLDIVANLQECLDAYFDEREVTCARCRGQALSTCLYMTTNECVIVSVNQTTSDFAMPLHVNVQGKMFYCRSLIVDKEGTIRYFSRLWDGSFKQFEDTKISSVHFGTLSTADYLLNSKLTFIFESKVEKKQLQELRLSEDEDGDLLDKSAIEDSGSVITQSASPQKSISTMDRGVQTVPCYSFENCKHNPKFKLFTGLTAKDFIALYNLIGGHEAVSKLKFKYSATPRKLRPTKHSSEDKLMIFLLRLRRGLPLEELAEIFSCSVSWVGEICYAMTRLIYLTFKELEDEMFPSAEAQRVKKPLKMKPFKNLRILMDGVSFNIQTPSNFEHQSNTYSQYKSHSVLVFTVGISCNGATIFCSDGMEGSMSDKGVILKSGLLERLSPGDGVMTDRGYELTAELQAKGCEFYKPPLLGGRQNFTAEEEILTKAIASARIYTEHAMADIKDNRLLQGDIPMTLLPVLSDLVYIAAYLRNFNQCRILNKKIVSRPSQPEDPLNDPDDPSGQT